VYKGQVYQNLVQRTHWQVNLAERVVKKTIDKLNSIVNVDHNYLIKGTHEDKSENYIIELRKTLNKSTYSSRSATINVAEPIGNYNILFTHGFGSNGYFPVSLNLIREIWKVISEHRNNNVLIERISVGHSHWLTSELDMDGFKISVNGGFQKWEYSVSQRPAGCILFMYCNGECSVIPVRPNEEVEFSEKKYNALEYKNMKYYAETLMDHLDNYETEHSN